MKYIIVPGPVHIVDKFGKPVYAKRGDEAVPYVVSHADFVNDYICAHPKTSAGGGDGARRQAKLRAVFDGSNPGDVIGVEDADYRVAKAVVDTMEWSLEFARYADQMLPHIEAWEAAEKQDHVWKKKRDEGTKAAL